MFQSALLLHFPYFSQKESMFSIVTMSLSHCVAALSVLALALPFSVKFVEKRSFQPLMAAGEDKASELLLKCIDEGRVDVLCSIVSQLRESFLESMKTLNCLLAEGKPDFHDQVDIICCTEGTLLHHAVAKGCSYSLDPSEQHAALDSTDSVNALLNNGVNPCVQNDAGKTAYQVRSFFLSIPGRLWRRIFFQTFLFSRRSPMEFGTPSCKSFCEQSPCPSESHS